MLLSAITSVWCPSPRAARARSEHGIAVVNSPADCDDMADSYDCFHVDAVRGIGKDRRPKIIWFPGPVPLAEIQLARGMHPTAFICVCMPEAVNRATLLTEVISAGANMVAYSREDAKQCFDEDVLPLGMQEGPYKCPLCGYDQLTEDDLWSHIPLYHSHHKCEVGIGCPICNRKVHDLAVHMRNRHGPVGRGEMESDDLMEAPALHAFAFVICRDPSTGKYLTVMECADEGFGLPGGSVNPKEHITEAAIRETFEEAGVAVSLKGVVQIEYIPALSRSGTWETALRAIFFAEPVQPAPTPKCRPNWDSVGACWVSPSEVKALPLRSDEVLQRIQYLEQGGHIFPLDVLA